MALPSFISLDHQRKPPSKPSTTSSPPSSAPNYAHPTPKTIKLATRPRFHFSFVCLASHWMFGPFLVGTILSFISIFLTPFSLYTRLLTIPIAIFTFLTALTTTAATIIATVMFIIFKRVIHSAENTVNIVPEIGRAMFAFMWIATTCAVLGWGVQIGLCCCCASRRDVRLGKKWGRRGGLGGGEGRGERKNGTVGKEGIVDLFTVST